MAVIAGHVTLTARYESESEEAFVSAVTTVTNINAKAYLNGEYAPVKAGKISAESGQ